MAPPVTIHESVPTTPINPQSSINPLPQEREERVVILQNDLERQLEQANRELPSMENDMKAHSSSVPASMQQIPIQAVRFQRSAASARRRQWWNNVKINLFIAALLIAILLLIILGVMAPLS